MKTLYKNGLIVSGSSADDFSTCMLVQDDRIAYTGHEAELQGSFDKVVDLQGRRVLPGLIDGYVLLVFFSRLCFFVLLGGRLHGRLDVMYTSIL